MADGFPIVGAVRPVRNTDGMKRVPLCGECGGRHYNFLGCPAPLRQVFRVREGFRDFADKTDSVVIADGVYGRVRRPIHEETAA